MDSFTERSDKVGSCAKASMGRGFTYFALFNNGECLSSWDASSTYDYYGYVRATKQYCYYYCFWGCYGRCYTYLTQCGDGYGDSTTMNVYSFTSKSHTMWFCLFLFVVVVVVYYCFILSPLTLDDTANRWISLFGEGLARTNLKYVTATTWIRICTIHSITFRWQVSTPIADHLLNPSLLILLTSASKMSVSAKWLFRRSSRAHSSEITFFFHEYHIKRLYTLHKLIQCCRVSVQ